MYLPDKPEPNYFTDSVCHLPQPPLKFHKWQWMQ